MNWSHFSHSSSEESCVNSEDDYSQWGRCFDLGETTCIILGSRTEHTALGHGAGTLQVSRSDMN